MLVPLMDAAALAAPPARQEVARTFCYVESPAGIAYSQPIPVFEYQVDKFANRIGTWQAVVPVDAPLNLGNVLAASITTGWKVSIRQEWNNPFGSGATWLLYQGEVQRREYAHSGDSIALSLSGVSKNNDLTRNSIHDAKVYGSYGENVALSTIIDDIAGRHIQLPAGNDAEIAATFHDGTLFEAILKVGELGRLTLRETWDGDALEFVPVDGAPWSGITVINVEQADPAMVG